VACASILAKTHRDGLMRELEDEHSGYGFAKHKGYGTPEHQRALREQGACAIHRLSYAPVAALQRTDPELREALAHSLEGCSDVTQMQAWVESALRPAYGSLDPRWVEALRNRYADKLAAAALGGLPE